VSRFVLVVAGLVLWAVAAVANEPPSFPPGLYGDESVTTTDGAAGFLVNPAAGGLRYPSELIVSWGSLEPAFPGLAAGPGLAAESRNTLRGAFSIGGFGLAGSHVQDGANEIRLGLAGGGPLRVGGALSWLRGSSGSDRALDLSVGTLLRPAPWSSFGAVVDHVAQPGFLGSTLAREYTMGVGVRPLAFDRARAHTWGTRLTLSADVRLREGSPNSTARTRYGGELEVVPGIALRGTVENGGAYRLGFGLLGTTAGYHGQQAYTEDGDRTFGTHTVSLHEGEEKTILELPAADRVAVVRVSGRLSDESLAGFGLLESGGGAPSWWVHQQLERALEDPLTRGVLLDVRGVTGMTHVEELRPRIEKLRRAGKPVVAYLPYGEGRAGLLLAAACDRVVTSPEAYYRSLGLRVEQRYYRSLLERWGIRLERTSHGKYKSAYREYSSDSTDDAERESIEQILDTNQELFVSTAAHDRGHEPDRLLAALDGRWWRSEDLRELGWVDSVGHRAVAEGTLGQLTGLGGSPRTVRYEEVSPARREWAVPTRLAVIYASGGIALGGSGNDLVFGPFLGAETALRQIEAAFDNPSVEAVVLRVESPGGDALASEVIRAGLVRSKEKTGKPLIVSMGSVAASGGYLIAAPGDRIYANRFTYTGSIGTFFVKPSAEGLLRNWGIRQDEFERGAYMRGLSLGRDWDAAIQASADSATMRHYRAFVDVVAGHRGQTWEAVDSVAQGRVWMGDDALARGLVDEIGTLEDAIAEARRRAGIPTEEKIRMVQYRRPRPAFLERYLGSLVSDMWARGTRLPEFGATYFWADVPETEEARDPFGLPFLSRPAREKGTPAPPAHVDGTAR
jgi:protease-4